MNQNLPIFKLSLNDDPDTGVTVIALVDDPAIKRHFMAFQKQKNPSAKFLATNFEQHIISGPLMVADMCILRDDELHGEHYVYFDAPTIRQIIFRFFKNGLTSNVNLMHLPDAKPNGIYMFESFIIDEKRGIPTPQGFDVLPNGSWFGSYKIDNIEIWEHFIKTGEFKGFSVEGFFTYNQMLTKEETLLKEIIDLVSGEIEP